MVLRQRLRRWDLERSRSGLIRPRLAAGRRGGAVGPACGTTACHDRPVGRPRPQPAP